MLTQGQDGALTYRAPAHFTAMPSPPSWSHLTGKLRQIPVNNRKRSFIIQCCPSTSFPHSFIPLESHADVQRALRPQHSESFPACDCRSRRRGAKPAPPEQPLSTSERGARTPHARLTPRLGHHPNLVTCFKTY